jgi:hypothetical protein
VGEALNDRIAAFLAGEAEAPAQIIARDFLRLAAPEGASTVTLVRALLARDARFEEHTSGIWRLAPAPAALPLPVVLASVEIPAGAGREPWLWRVSATHTGVHAPVLSHQGTRETAVLNSLLEDLRRYPVATEQPGALTRWVGAQERLHAVPEIDPIVIDLRAWQALLCEPDSSAAHVADSSEAPSSAAVEGFAALSGRLERVVAWARDHALRSWREVAEAPRGIREAAREDVWNPERAFTRETLAALPEEPGIYRFFSQEGELLYVGKSKNLRRRIAAHFLPAEPHAPRAERLRTLHRFEYETAGSELEALIREVREIRERRPAWNVQIDLGEDAGDYPATERDLLLLLPDATGAASLFVLAGERAGFQRYPGDAPPDGVELAARLERFYRGEPTADGIVEVAAPERKLVRRWLRWEEPGATRLRLADFASYAQAAAALLGALAPASPADGDGRVILREGTPRREGRA